MNKALLRGQLQTVKNNFALVQVGIALMAHPDARERFLESLAAVKGHSETSAVEYIAYVFDTEELLKRATREFRNAALRNCLKEMFELVKAYGDATNQSSIIKAAPEYQFLRVLRNCLSHDLRVHFTAYDEKLLPVVWSGLTLDRSMQDAPLPMRDFLSRSKALELIDEVIVYIEQRVG